MKWTLSAVLALATLLAMFTAVDGSAAQAPSAQSFLRGLEQYRAGDFEAARTEFAALLAQIGPDHPMAPEVRHYLGKSLMGQQRFDAAAEHLKASYEARPGSARSAQACAEALFFAGSYEECLPVFEKAAALDAQTGIKALYYTGIAQLKLGRTDKGVSALRTLVRKVPGTREAASATEILAAVEDAFNQAAAEAETRQQAVVKAAPRRPTREKPWNLTLNMGLEYDDNVSLIPDSTAQLPGDVSSKGNARLVHSLGGAYRIIDQGPQSVELSASYAGSKHKDLEDFDVDTVGGGALWRYTLRPYQFRTGAYVSRTWVDGDARNWTYSLAPGFSWQPRRWTWTDLDYRYARTVYDDEPPTANADENRDAHTQDLTARQSLSFPGLLLKGYSTLFSLAITAETSDTTGGAYEYDALGTTVSFQQGLPFRVVLVTAYTYREIDYDNANTRSTNGSAREDRENTFNARVYKKITDRLSAYAGYRKYDNDSNIPDFFQYESDVWAGGVRFDF